MKKLLKTIPLFLLLFSLITLASYGQSSVFGKWKTIDDETGEAKSVVEIYEKNGKAYGKIIKIFNEKKQDAICDECDDDDPRKNKKILGMEIIKDMKKDGNEWTGGKILDPNSGSEYKSTMWLDNGKLHVRGYVGFSFIGRTQVWERIE